ncbi:MAG: hypothetical protein V3R49_03825 [Gammaproteobacteria bacterium]
MFGIVGIGVVLVGCQSFVSLFFVNVYWLSTTTVGIPIRILKALLAKSVP